MMTYPSKRLLLRALSPLCTVLWLGACAQAADTPLSPATSIPAAANATHSYSPSAALLSAEVVGQGPDVVLIPGLASDGDVWDTTVAAMSSDYRLHRLAFAGMGETPVADRSGPLLPAARDALLAYLADNDLRDAILVGHSMGGLLSLMAADADSSRIARVVSVDSLPFYALLFDPTLDEDTARLRGRALADQMMAVPKGQYDAMQAQGAAIYAKSPEARVRIVANGAASDRRTVTDAMAELMGTDFRPRLSAISVPVHIVYAFDATMPMSRDTVTARFEGDYANLSDVQFTRIEDSYHFVMDDQPEAFQAALRQSLSKAQMEAEQ